LQKCGAYYLVIDFGAIRVKINWFSETAANSGYPIDFIRGVRYNPSMVMTISGKLLGASKQLPRCPGDSNTLLIEIGDTKSDEKLNLVCQAKPEMKSLFLAAQSDTAPTVTLTVQASPLSLKRLTNGQVDATIYKLLVVGLVEGLPAVRLQATQVARQPRPL
jgi:hypothetical protein